uniref:Ig-like domain-containing protein n=1 Tax=Athene cunicularia TaxID=194338 RepID=A0A663MKX4_ATHCN
MHQLPPPSPHLIFTGFQAQIPQSKERQSEGSTLYVQCPYTAQANSYQPKVWYRVRYGEVEFLALTTNPTKYLHTNQSTNGNVTIEDNPIRTVTITMHKLQAQDTGVYWCGLYQHSHINLIMEASVNVSKSEYLLPESGSVSVRCPYSAPEYGAASKAWCKEGAREGCSVLVTTNSKPSQYQRTFQHGKLTIQDDTEQGVVTITMGELQAQDSGVYSCALYEHNLIFRMVEVTLNISEGDSNVNFFILLSGILSVLFILALISLVTLCVRQRKRLKGRGMWRLVIVFPFFSQLDSTGRIGSPKDDSKDLKYVTLNFTSQLIPEDPLYCNVEPSQAHRKPKDENVEYAIIALKQVPTNDKG